jgi:hypothetical protein
LLGNGRLTVSLAVAGTILAAAAAYAGFTFNTAPSPGGFMQAGAGPSTPDSAPWPGSDFAGQHSTAGCDFHELSFAGNGSYSNGANGGWTETFVISSPANTGHHAIQHARLRHACCFRLCRLMRVYSHRLPGRVSVDGQQLLQPGGSDLQGTDRQYGHWAIATYGNPPTDGKTVNDHVTFAVPFTYGTPFKLGIYAVARAGMRSSSGVAGNSTADSNFSNGLTWGGITNVYLAGAPTADYSITSGTGINWGGPVGPPNPADLNGDGTTDGADLGILLGEWS